MGAEADRVQMSCVRVLLRRGGCLFLRSRLTDCKENINASASNFEGIIYRPMGSTQWSSCALSVNKMNGQLSNRPSRWVNWLVACLAVFLICLFVTCGGLLWRAVTVFNEKLDKAAGALLREALEQKLDQWLVVLIFLGNLNPADIEGSYDYTSEAFRRRQSLSEFADFIGRHPESAVRLGENG
jgi:hypothetical protein